MEDRNKPVVVEQEYNVSVKDLWDAITELDQMKKWFFHNIPSFEPETGFHTEFLVHSGNRDFTHLWTIDEVIPGKKIKFHWSYEEYEGEGMVTFELVEMNERTLLRLTNEGLESFPQDIPEFKRESCVDGWEYFLKKNLKEYLEQA